MAMTELAAAGPPPAAVVIAAARSAADALRDRGLPHDPEAAREALELAASRALDAWAPGIDEETDLPGSAEWLGFPGPDSIRGRWRRRRIDGTPKWPEPHQKFGKNVWTYREIAVHKALEPGRGRPGQRRGPQQRTRAARGTRALSPESGEPGGS